MHACIKTHSVFLLKVSNPAINTNQPMAATTDKAVVETEAYIGDHEQMDKYTSHAVGRILYYKR